MKNYFALAFLALVGTGTILAGTAANTGSSMPKPAPAFKRTLPSTNERSTQIVQERSVFRVLTPDPTPARKLEGQISGSSSAQSEFVIKTSAEQITGSRPVPPSMFRAWLEAAHREFALSCALIPESNVMAIRGVYDNSGKTLQALGIPFRASRGADLINMPLSQMKVVLVDCPGRVPPAAYQKLRDFVAGGGYLLTTDWSSDNVIQGAFPGYIEWDRKKNRQSIYDAHPVNPDSVLFKRTVSNASWKMDIDAHMIRILRPEVRILAASHQLEMEDPSSKGALAVVFPFGKGYVMHMVGHFDNNTVMSFRHMLADPAPVIGISLRQALAANFVVAGLMGKKL